MTPRARRYDQGSTRWTERDDRLLRWIGEQYIIRFDQLARLAGRWAEKETKTPGRLGKTTTFDLVARWRKAGVVESGTLLVQQPIWCWLTPRGQRQVGLEAALWEPRGGGYRGLKHRYFVNQVRLWLEPAHPEAVWTSERQLQRGTGRRTKGTRQGHMPDAEVQLAGAHIAIEVELTTKEEERWNDILEELGQRYDQMWYFAPPSLHRDLGQALEHLDAKTRTKVSLSAVNESDFQPGADGRDERSPERRPRPTPSPPPTRTRRGAAGAPGEAIGEGTRDDGSQDNKTGQTPR